MNGTAGIKIVACLNRFIKPDVSSVGWAPICRADPPTRVFKKSSKIMLGVILGLVSVHTIVSFDNGLTEAVSLVSLTLS